MIHHGANGSTKTLQCQGHRVGTRWPRCPCLALPCLALPCLEHGRGSVCRPEASKANPEKKWVFLFLSSRMNGTPARLAQVGLAAHFVFNRRPLSPYWRPSVARAGKREFSDPRSFLPFSLSAACLKFCQTHVTTLLQEWPAFRFRAAPPGDDPTLIDRVAA